MTKKPEDLFAPEEPELLRTSDKRLAARRREVEELCGAVTAEEFICAADGLSPKPFEHPKPRANATDLWERIAYALWQEAQEKSEGESENN